MTKLRHESPLDQGGFTAELRLMLAMMRSVSGSGAIRLPECEQPPQIDWPQFLSLVRHHRVYPQLHARLRDVPWVPYEIREAVRLDGARNTLRMLRSAGELQRVCRALTAGGIRSLVLKGPPLALDLYGDLSLRTSKDLDILIPLADLPKAERLMEQLGYRNDRRVPRAVGDWKWKVHHASFTNPHTGMQVEIHWRLNGDMGKEPSFEELWDRRRTSPLDRQAVCMLGREELFEYLCLHGARHGWFRLRWLADIDRIARLGLDVRRLLPLMRRHRSLHLGGQALALASGLFATPIPTGLEPLLPGRGRQLAQLALPYIEQTAVPTSEASSKESDSRYKRYLFALKTPGQKIGFAVRRLHPSFRDAEALPLPRPLRFLYFPLRPFVWLWRQLRQQT